MKYEHSNICTHRPDFNVNSPNSNAPFFKAASMKAVFSGST